MHDAESFTRSRRLALAAGAAGLLGLGLGGCAAVSSLTSQVSSFGEWPAGRAPGRYAFERLPSQQARAAETQALEDAARPALAKAGFVPAAAGEEPEVLVQVAARVGRADVQPWDESLWWRGGFGVWRHGPWPGPRWALSVQVPPGRWEHEVALLLRDRASGKPLFETRASRETHTGLASAPTLVAMFEAALVDFPRTGLNPRPVQVPLGTR